MSEDEEGKADSSEPSTLCSEESTDRGVGSVCPCIVQPCRCRSLDGRGNAVSSSVCYSDQPEPVFASFCHRVCHLFALPTRPQTRLQIPHQASPRYEALDGPLTSRGCAGPRSVTRPDQSSLDLAIELRDGCPCPDVLGFKAAHRLIERFTSFFHHWGVGSLRREWMEEGTSEAARDLQVYGDCPLSDVPAVIGWSRDTKMILRPGLTFQARS